MRKLQAGWYRVPGGYELLLWRGRPTKLKVVKRQKRMPGDRYQFRGRLRASYDVLQKETGQPTEDQPAERPGVSENSSA